mmetsp:Transcript_29582/g.64305  ORF Transcript_29582/g.64305 Transcript_29582/m.64305 type:complete len:143 (-) Transcript_29582:1197-1625(-)
MIRISWQALVISREGREASTALLASPPWSSAWGAVACSTGAARRLWTTSTAAATAAPCAMRAAAACTACATLLSEAMTSRGCKTAHPAGCSSHPRYAFHGALQLLGCERNEGCLLGFDLTLPAASLNKLGGEPSLILLRCCC